MTIFTALRSKTAGAAAVAVMTALVLLAAAPSLPSAPAPGRSLEEAKALLDRWDLPGARRILDGHPGTADPALEWLRGMAAFYGGEYEVAYRLLDSAAASIGGHGEGGGALVRLVGETLALSHRLTAFESEHFVLFLDAERDWVLAEPALATLEKAYAALGEWFGHFPAGKVRVEIIPSAGDFEKVSSLSQRDIETSGAIGICKFNKIMLLSPRVLLQGYRWRDSLVHEYIHYLLVALSANRAPIWLQEGVARYGETLWRSPESLHLSLADEGLLARARREGSLVPFRSMDPSLVKLPTMAHVQLAFAQCALAVEFILREWQSEGLRNLLAVLGEGEPRDGADSALRKTFGIGLTDFEERWRRELETRQLREVPGLVVPELRVAGGKDGTPEQEWELARWQPLEAQRHLKLGDMLRGRKRLPAALREYGRALKIAPASPYILNRESRVLLELSRFAEAEESLRSAVAVHPDYPTTYSLLASLLERTGRTNEAETALRQYLEINPFDPFVWRDLGLLLEKLGRGEEARRSREVSLRLDPSTGGPGPFMGGED